LRARSLHQRRESDERDECAVGHADEAQADGDPALTREREIERQSDHVDGHVLLDQHGGREDDGPPVRLLPDLDEPQPGEKERRDPHLEVEVVHEAADEIEVAEVGDRDPERRRVSAEEGPGGQEQGDA
jgi:hypothetical protein